MSLELVRARWLEVAGLRSPVLEGGHCLCGECGARAYDAGQLGEHLERVHGLEASVALERVAVVWRRV